MPKNKPIPSQGNLPPCDVTLAAVEAWCNALPRIGGGPAKGSLAVGLVILERSFVGQILAMARETGKYGPVAQYLVGAKLQLRFPEVVVRNESYSAPDQQTGQPGDFVVGDTAFHVTVAPTTGHFEKCVRNLREGHSGLFKSHPPRVKGPPGYLQNAYRWNRIGRGLKCYAPFKCS